MLVKKSFGFQLNFIYSKVDKTYKVSGFLALHFQTKRKEEKYYKFITQNSWF